MKIASSDDFTGWNVPPEDGEVNEYLARRHKVHESHGGSGANVPPEDEENIECLAGHEAHESDRGSVAIEPDGKIVYTSTCVCGRGKTFSFPGFEYCHQQDKPNLYLVNTCRCGSSILIQFDTVHWRFVTLDLIRCPECGDFGMSGDRSIWHNGAGYVDGPGAWTYCGYSICETEEEFPLVLERNHQPVPLTRLTTDPQALEPWRFLIFLKEIRQRTDLLCFRQGLVFAEILVLAGSEARLKEERRMCELEARIKMWNEHGWSASEEHATRLRVGKSNLPRLGKGASFAWKSWGGHPPVREIFRAAQELWGIEVKEDESGVTLVVPAERRHKVPPRSGGIE